MSGKVSNFFNNAEEYLLVGALSVSVIVVFVQVIMRYVFKNSLSWSEEVARYLFLWISWVGASYAVRENYHFRVTMFADILKGKSRQVFELLVLFVWFAFSIFIVYQAFILNKMIFLRGQLSPALEMPMLVPYASVLVGCGLMCFRLISKMRETIAKIQGRDMEKDSNPGEEVS